LKDSQMLNKVIPYVICQGDANSKGFDRAYHPEEYYESNLNSKSSGCLLIDGLYYLENQIFKPLNRILVHVREVDIMRLGEILCVNEKTLNQAIVEQNKEEHKELMMQK
jgi:DNA polymerase elongation subunit (family B)